MSATGPLLELRDVGKVFEPPSLFLGKGREATRALDKVSLQVARGKTLGIVGESGSGKSTLANIVLGLERPTSGEVLFDGGSTVGLRGRPLKAFRRRVQMVFQDPQASLDPRFSVAQTVEEPLIIHGLGNAVERRRAVEQTLEESGLVPASSYLGRYPHELSGGQRQRVAIARAIVLRPDLLIADEPVSMLDVSVRAGVLKLLRSLVTARDMAMVFITHDLSIVSYICDDVAIFYRGSLVERGPAIEVMRAPSHPYTRQLVAAVPLPEVDGLPFAVPVAPLADRPVAGGCLFCPRCPLAREVCLTQQPLLLPIGARREAACHRVIPREESDE